MREQAALIELVRSIEPRRLARMVDRAVASAAPDELRALMDAVDTVTAERQRGPSAVRAYATPGELAGALDPTYQPLQHLRLLSDAIADTVREADERTGPGRLIVSMPPQVGKSTTTSVWAPLWFLNRHPGRQVVLASYAANLAAAFGRRVRDRVVEHTDRLQVRLSRSVTAMAEWETTAGGGMLSVGIGGSITGRGADLLVVDDPIKGFVEAHSHAVRDRVWSWWLSDAGTRLAPTAAVVVVMTRWHEDDPVGRLLSNEHEGDPGDWRVLRIPALGEGVDADEAAQQVAPDALARAEGVPLCKPGEDEQQAAERWERERRNAGPYVWAGLYQQRPSEPTGTILRRSWWSYYHRQGDQLVLPDGTLVPVAELDVVQSWDLSFSDATDASRVVGQVWGARGADRFLLDQTADRMDYVAAKRAMRRLRADWPSTRTTYVEDKANGPAIIADLRRELSGLHPVNPQGSKQARAWSIQGDVESGNVHLPAPSEAPWVRELVEEAAQFPNGAHDDQVDALTQALSQLRGAGPARAYVPRGSQAEHAGRGRTRVASARIER